MAERHIDPLGHLGGDLSGVADEAATYLSILNMREALDAAEPKAAEFVHVDVLVERSIASIVADPAGVLRRAVVDGLHERGVGRSRRLSSYGWGLIQSWGLCYTDDFRGPIRACLRAPNDHTRVDLAKAVRQTQRLSGPAIFIALGTSLADAPEMADAGQDHNDGFGDDADEIGYPVSDAQRLEVDVDGRYPSVLLFGALDGPVRQEVAEEIEAAGGVALPVTNPSEIAAFVERCAEVYGDWVKQIEADCDAGTLDLRRLCGLD